MVIPLGDDDSTRRTIPVVTFGLIALNVLVFLFELSRGGNIERFFQTWSVIPVEYARMTDLAPRHPGPFWVTTFSSMFMHGGWMHLGGNMLFLWIFGDNVEDSFGRGRFLLFYLACGIVASLAQVLLDSGSDIPSLGASGAISGVLAAYVVMFPRQRVRVLMGRAVTSMPALFVIGLWILLQFVNGLGQLARTEQTGGVAYAAHVGGFLAGLILVWPLRKDTAGRPA